MHKKLRVIQGYSNLSCTSIKYSGLFKKLGDISNVANRIDCWKLIN